MNPIAAATNETWIETVFNVFRGLQNCTMLTLSSFD